MHWLKTAVLCSTLAATGWAHATTPDSREYKARLNPARFATHPDSASNAFLADLQTALTDSSYHGIITGRFEPSRERTIRFYDSPGSCALRAQSYSLRERIGKKRELTLKFRTTSAQDASNLQPIGSGPHSKFEMDKTVSVEAYSRSAKQNISKDQSLDSMQDIKHLYPNATGLDITGTTPLSIVSGLSIREKTYSGPASKLDPLNAKFTISLWYLNKNDTPVVAEVSFTVEQNEDGFTDGVTQRSEQIFNTLNRMSTWVAPQAMPKTNWVYQYDPAFCSANASPSTKTEKEF